MWENSKTATILDVRDKYQICFNLFTAGQVRIWQCTIETGKEYKSHVLSQKLLRSLIYKNLTTPPILSYLQESCFAISSCQHFQFTWRESFSSATRSGSLTLFSAIVSLIVISALGGHLLRTPRPDYAAFAFPRIFDGQSPTNNLVHNVLILIITKLTLWWINQATQFRPCSFNSWHHQENQRENISLRFHFHL